MKDYSNFLKCFNAALTKPEGAACTMAFAAEPSLSHSDAAAMERAADSAWRQILVRDSAGKEMASTASTLQSTGSGVASRAAGGNAGTVLAPTATPSHQTAAAAAECGAPFRPRACVTTDKLEVSAPERWRIQNQLRKDDAQRNPQRKEIARKGPRLVTTKGPTDGAAFPAGRGRPV